MAQTSAAQVTISSEDEDEDAAILSVTTLAKRSSDTTKDTSRVKSPRSTQDAPRTQEQQEEGLTAAAVSRQLGHIADQTALGMHQLLTQQRELSAQLETTRRQLTQGHAEGTRYQTRAIALSDALTQQHRHRTALQALMGQLSRDSAGDPCAMSAFLVYGQPPGCLTSEDLTIAQHAQVTPVRVLDAPRQPAVGMHNGMTVSPC
eukprot:1269391-Amphidinium_carterae.1